MSTAKPRVCVVTGAGGFIGGRLIRSLAASTETIAIVRPGAADVPGAARTIGVDLRQPRDLARLLPARADAIIHLAQSPRFRDFPEGVDDVFAVNVHATQALLDYAHRAGVSHAIVASSGGVYGSGERVFDEQSPIDLNRNQGFYLASKMCAEVLARSYRDLFTVVTLRLFFVYGACQKAGMLIPRLIESIRTGRPIALQGEDGIRLNPTHVTDVVEAIGRAIGLDASATVNIAGPEVLTLRQIGETIGELVGRPPHFDVERETEPRHLVGDIGLMTRLFGAPRIRFAQGIREAVSAIPSAAIDG